MQSESGVHVRGRTRRSFPSRFKRKNGFFHSDPKEGGEKTKQRYHQEVHQNLRTNARDIVVTTRARQSEPSCTNRSHDESGGSDIARLSQIILGPDHARGHSENRTISYRIGSSGIHSISDSPHSVCRGISHVAEGERSERVDDGHSERVHPSDSRTRDHTIHRLRRVPFIRQFQMVCKAILNPKKIILPVAVLSPAFLFASFQHAKAEVLSTTANAREMLLQRDGFLKMILEKGKDAPVLDGPITQIAKKAVKENPDGIIDKANGFFDMIHNIHVWFTMLPINVLKFSMDTLFVKIYEWLTYVLHVPLFLFTNTFIKDATLVFSGISILIVTILTMIEGNKRMLKKTHTDLKDIAKRFFVAVVGAGFAPMLFEKTFSLINSITDAIRKIGSSAMKPNDCFDEEAVKLLPKDAMKQCLEVLDVTWVDWVNTLGLIAFDVLLLALTLQIFLENGRRFFDLMVLAAMAPLALSAWIFDDHRHMFYTWWGSLKKISITPLIYAVFLCLLGIFLFATSNVTGGGLVIKMIIMAGALVRMANPPNFVKSRIESGEDADGMIWKTIDAYRNAYDTVTLRKLRTTKWAKDKAGTMIANRNKKIQSLRKQHNRRYVKDLM